MMMLTVDDDDYLMTMTKLWLMMMMLTVDDDDYLMTMTKLWLMMTDDDDADCWWRWLLDDYDRGMTLTVDNDVKW